MCKIINAIKNDYEKYGFFNHVIFTCGIICDDDKVRIYYVAADQSHWLKLKWESFIRPYFAAGR